jgi:hypothetical protein
MISGWNNNDFYVPNDVHVGGSLITSIAYVPYPQIRIVAKSGSLYPTITSAQNSITDAASNKIYTVLALPGEYDEALILKDYVNIVAIDPFNTYILRQVTDNGVPVHCNLKINIDNRQIGGSHGLYLKAASVIRFDGNIIGADGSYSLGVSAGAGIYNEAAGIVTVLNGNITGGKTGSTYTTGGHGIYNHSTGKITVLNCKVTGGSSDDYYNNSGGNGIYNNSTGIVIVSYSDIAGGKDTKGTGGTGVYNKSTGTIIFSYGDVTGGEGNSGGGSGIINEAGTIIILNTNITGGEGKVSYGGKGIYNKSTGTVTFSNGIIKGGKCNNSGGTDGYGIQNVSTGLVKVSNGKITSLGTKSDSYPISGGSVILDNCIIYGIHADVPAIYADEAKNVKCMNVWSNRALGANITNLIADGFHVDANVEI